MPDQQLKLPPHLTRPPAGAAPADGAAATAGNRPPRTATEPLPPERASDMVSVTTPLGTLTCPPGRLKLNLLQGGMPRLPGHG